MVGISVIAPDGKVIAANNAMLKLTGYSVSDINKINVKDIYYDINERPEVLNAIEAHHGDEPATSPYTPIVMAADTISASRPGGRRDSLERYIQRLQQLEEIAKEPPGVKEAFAIQAGREIRVIVDAKRVDDATAEKIARDVAKKVEDQMTYPGEIRVTVLRELRAVAVAR